MLALDSGKDLMWPQEEAPLGRKVRVRQDHGIKELRGTVGEVVGSFYSSSLLEGRFPEVSQEFIANLLLLASMVALRNERGGSSPRVPPLCGKEVF